MLGNVLGRHRHASQRPRHTLQRPRHAGNILGVLGMYGSLVVHYSLGFTAYKAASGGFFFDVGLLGPCEKACRGGRGRCQACLGVAKQAYTS